MLYFNKLCKYLKTSLWISGIIIFFFLTDAGSDSGKATMVKSVMCESIVNFQPVNPAVVFSISKGEVFCFSMFDPVNEKTAIFHKWYKRDQLIFTMKLTLSPPKWSTFSRIQIRNEDKGPWRVDIRNENDNLLQSLRFSMAE
jgi:Protein of unknown function (DUF2914)